ncbi:MAG: hypothetical protein E7339_04770 [Clostridiales bacterium]|nr:hypothetical protein [Clostridiales bacterium]
MSLRNKSFIWGSVTSVVLFIIGIATGNILLFTILALTGFTLVSCLILGNNFIGDMILQIFSWGFVRFPGLIFTLDLDGIIWLITVKLLFWVLGFLLATLFGLLAIILGLALSVVVYPFALVKNIRNGEVK